ncbi:MAG TPA: GAF and ANTAR domain-containing protein [Pseudonocardiaceae bacterium]|nr:GAF and ANTAR domain-containing protein [Pseudonocardiaceae bacterium]
MREDSVRRADALAEAFVGLADTLVDDYDVIELLHRLTTYCVRLLPIEAAGILLSDQRGELRVVASSTEEARIVQQFTVESGEGPGVECFRNSREVAVADLRDDGQRWREFAERAEKSGFRAVNAVPLRLRSQTIGALSIFRAEPGLLTAEDVKIGQGLADMATISILHERALSQRTVLVEQLQFALSSRVIIEQAKGVLAERCRVDMGEAFAMLRKHARNNNLRLADVAKGVVAGTVELSQVSAPQRR